MEELLHCGMDPSETVGLTSIISGIIFFSGNVTTVYNNIEIHLYRIRRKEQLIN